MPRKLKITPATADTLHEYALALGFKDQPIPPSSKFERYRIQSAASYERGDNEFIFFYNNGRGSQVTIYGEGASTLLDDFLEHADD